MDFFTSVLNDLKISGKNRNFDNLEKLEEWIDKECENGKYRITLIDVNDYLSQHNRNLSSVKHPDQISPFFPL